MSFENREIAGLQTHVEIAGEPATAIVVLHGYSMTPADFAPFTQALKINGNFYLPQAPYAAEGGGFSWWPIDPRERQARGAVDLADVIPEGRALIRSLIVDYCNEIQRQMSGLPLVVCGFSQGGMLACDAVLCGNLNVAALALLSASRIAISEWRQNSARLQYLPVLVSHGYEDAVLPYAAGEGLRDFATASGALVTWVPFEGGHQTPLQVWRAIRHFVNDNALRRRD